MDPISLIILGVLGAFGLLWTLFGGKGGATLVLPRQGSTEAETKASEVAASKALEATVERDLEEANARAAAEKARQDLIDTLQEHDDIAADPEALNEHLKNVGKDVRGDRGGT